MTDDQGIPIGASVETVEAYLGGGGGSSPGVIYVTFDAATIAEAWESGDGIAALPVASIDHTTWVAGVGDVANTLDENVTSIDMVAYDADASSTDVYTLGDGLGYTSALTFQAGNGFAYAVAISAGSTWAAGVLIEGKRAYLIVSGDGAPTTGSITVGIIVS